MSRFVWYDLMTGDMKTGGAFYEDVVGWKASDSGVGSADYWIFSKGSTMVSGMMPLPTDGPSAGAPPCWTGYVGVDDVDAYTKRVTEAGGSVHRAPEDIPEVGRFSVVTDPSGAAFILFKPNGDQQPDGDTMSAGRIGWHELNAANAEKDFEFYGKLFDWKIIDTHDMGPMGLYHIFGEGAGGAPIGGMMTKRPETPTPYWLYYFVVDGIDAAVGRVKDKGGKLWSEPMQVPGGTWVATGEDPTGATFAIMSITK